MIPTFLRAKLPGHLSYPIGAEALSTALAGAPHLDALRVSFFARPVEPASLFQGMLRDRRPYPIIRAEYSPRRKPGLCAAGFMIEDGWYAEHRKIMVYPVLRELRHVANRLLRERGLPALRRWLEVAEAAARGMMTERIELVFNPADESLIDIASQEHEASKV